MIKIKFVVNPPDNRVHVLAVDEDNPTLDVAICGNGPDGMEGVWADMVQDRAGFYPVSTANICMKCFPNLKQYQEEDVPFVVLNF